MAADSYKPRGGRLGKKSSPSPSNGGSTSKDDRAALIPCGGGWKTNWGYSCSVRVGGRNYKLMAFWNNKPKGDNPPAINFTIRENEQDGIEIEDNE